MLNRIKNDINPGERIEFILNELHRKGPTNSITIEELSYYKLFHKAIFEIYEERVLSTIGLFYKNKNPNNLFSFVLAQIGELYNKTFGEYLTPVQSSIMYALNSKKYISISAPTSAGKSFSIKYYICKIKGDVVIVVPSRALIAEYIETMNEHFKDDKTIMILPFVEYVFTSRELRRIFILTPERARELFTQNKTPNITLFFFDEAQISEEKERGIKFDVLVRRVEKTFPKAQLIFAHPFIENPEAQIKKHSLSEKEAYTYSYKHNTVGKIFIQHHSNGNDYYFSPNIKNCHILKNCIQYKGHFRDFAFNGKNTVLIYVSKSSIYNGKFIDEFEYYIKKLSKIKNSQALKIITKVENLIGVNKFHQSNMVNLLKKGVVIHHGSIPLEVRFLIEDFIKMGFAKICFATSTLAQGINMPFDIVWLDNMHTQKDITEEQRALAFKNLIGRSGRLTNKASFDYGYVYTKNPKLVKERLDINLHLSEQSILETEVKVDGDNKELIESILNEDFDDELNLPNSKIERLSEQNVLNIIKAILDITHMGKNEFGSNLFGINNYEKRNKIKEHLKKIFEISLNRLFGEGESEVFSQAIEILFHLMQNRSFKEIVGIRYNYISKRDGNREERPNFTQPAEKLPSCGLKRYSLFDVKLNIPAKDISYDTVVFDTYDYLDTVISYSLSNVFCGAFLNYYNITNDVRALDVINLFKYGTFNKRYILLIRYGFPIDKIDEIEQYVDKITEEEIIFNTETIKKCKEDTLKLIAWYLP